MRKTKVIKIDDQEITVKELRVKDIRQIITGISKIEDESDNFLFEEIKTFIPLLTDLDIEKIEELAPSELTTIMETIKEVNEDFFLILKKIGIDQIFKVIKETLQNNLTKIFVD